MTLQRVKKENPHDAKHPDKIFLNVPIWGFPGGTVGKQSACQFRGHRFNPWSGKIPHPVEQLSPCGTTTEPTPRAHEPLLSLCSATREATTMRSPRTTTNSSPPLTISRDS